MTKQEMIKKIAEHICDYMHEKNAKTNAAKSILKSIQQTHHLVEKDKVEVVEFKETMVYGDGTEVNTAKPAINKEWVL